MTKKRSPLQVSDNFHDKLKKIQEGYRKKTGKDISLREITDNIIRSPIFSEIEKRILAKNNTDLNISMDGRKL